MDSAASAAGTHLKALHSVATAGAHSAPLGPGHLAPGRPGGEAAAAHRPTGQAGPPAAGAPVLPGRPGLPARLARPPRASTRPASAALLRPRPATATRSPRRATRALRPVRLQPRRAMRRLRTSLLVVWPLLRSWASSPLCKAASSRAVETLSFLMLLAVLERHAWKE